MRQTEVEKALADIGINARDTDGNIRPPEELTEEVLALMRQCDESEDIWRLLLMLMIAKHIDREGI